MRKLIILAFFAAGLQWAVAQNTGYSLAVLSSRACVAAAGASWMVLNFSTTPEPRFANSCVGSYTTDLFVCPRCEPAPAAFGETIPYNMRFNLKIPERIDSSYDYCQHDTFIYMYVTSKINEEK